MARVSTTVVAMLILHRVLGLIGIVVSMGNKGFLLCPAYSRAFAVKQLGTGLEVGLGVGFPEVAHKNIGESHE